MNTPERPGLAGSSRDVRWRLDVRPGGRVVREGSCGRMLGSSGSGQRGRRGTRASPRLATAWEGTHCTAIHSLKNSESKKRSRRSVRPAGDPGPLSVAAAVTSRGTRVSSSLLGGCTSDSEGRFITGIVMSPTRPQARRSVRKPPPLSSPAPCTCGFLSPCANAAAAPKSGIALRSSAHPRRCYLSLYGVRPARPGDAAPDTVVLYTLHRATGGWSAVAIPLRSATSPLC